MPINPALALQVKGLELPDPMAQMAQVTQIQNALQQQRMGDIQMQNALREQRRKGEFERILGGFGPEAKVTDISPALVRGGFLTEARTLMQSEAQLEETRRKAEEARLKGMISEADIVGRVLGAAKDQASYDFAVQKLSSQGIFKPADVQFLGPTYDPARVKQILDTTMSQRDRLELAFKERTTAAAETTATAARMRAMTDADRAKWERDNPGFEIKETESGLVSVNKRTGQVAPLTMAGAAGVQPLMPKQPKTELARLQAERDALPVGSPARIEIEARIDALGRGAAPTLTEVIDPDEPSRMLRVDARTYTGGGVGSPGVIGISGKEPSAARRASVEEEGREQFRSILDDLRANFDKLNRMRAITSTERGPISNVATALETTGIGQVASRAVGGEAQAIRDEISSSRSMLLSALKKVTGKSASELNSNVELRTFLDSISDPSKSYESAINILENMEKTYLRGGGTSTGQRSATRRGEAPSGGTFSVTAPDGKTYTFPTQDAANQFRSRIGGR